MSKHFTADELFPTPPSRLLGVDLKLYAASLVRELRYGAISLKTASNEWAVITHGSAAPAAFAEAAAHHARFAYPRKFKPGDRVRFTTRFLRTTGVAPDDGDKVWSVISQRGEFVEVDEPSLLGADMGYRRINEANLERVK